MEGCIHYLAMVLVQLIYTRSDILIKLSLQEGLNLTVFVKGGYLLKSVEKPLVNVYDAKNYIGKTKPVHANWIKGSALILISHSAWLIPQFNKTLKSVRNLKLIRSFSSRARHFSSTFTAVVKLPQSDAPSSSFTFSSEGKENKNNSRAHDDSIYVKSSSSSSSKS
ncbi:hypothetical protein ACFX15_014177 [Malus domestica]